MLPASLLAVVGATLRATFRGELAPGDTRYHVHVAPEAGRVRLRLQYAPPVEEPSLEAGGDTATGRQGAAELELDAATACISVSVRGDWLRRPVGYVLTVEPVA